MPLFMSKEKEREYGIYERKEKNVAGDADIYCSCSGYRCRITPAKACPVCRNVYQTVWNNFLNLLKFIVVPIVLFSIMCGIISMRDIKKLAPLA